MKTLLIALLIVGAAAGIYFFVIRKDQPIVEKVDRKLLPGEWLQEQTDTLATVVRFDFRQENLLIRSTEKQSGVTVDSLYYDWTKEDDLLIKTTKEDSASGFLKLLQLTKDTLSVKAGDSTAIIFVKVK